MMLQFFRGALKIEKNVANDYVTGQFDLLFLRRLRIRVKI